MYINKLKRLLRELKLRSEMYNDSDREQLKMYIYNFKIFISLISFNF